ncbi:MAG TPA: NnrU family protein [Candidatus Binatia bacterium]
MTAAAWIVFWALAFAATHMGLSSLRVRPRLVATIGQGPYLAIYSLVAFATFVPLVRVWLRDLHGGGFLWNLRAYAVVHVVAMMVSWVFFTMAIAALVQPSPASVGPRATTRARGLTRITRHPLFMSIGIWALAHTVLNGFANDVLFFGGIFVVGLAGCMHQDARKRATEPELAEFYDETSLLPFVAIATGRNHLVLSEMPWMGLAAGAVVASMIYHYHAAMFG